MLQSLVKAIDFYHLWNQLDLYNKQPLSHSLMMGFTSTAILKFFNLRHYVLLPCEKEDKYETVPRINKELSTC